MHRLLRGQMQCRSRAGHCGKHSDGRAGVPALPDMLLAHAFADAWAYFVARDSRPQEIAAAKAGPQFRYGKERWQGHRADVQDTLAMNIVELEALNERAIDQRGMRRR